MRICGKRASQYSQPELFVMSLKWEDFSGNKLTPEQIKEIRKVYQMRKGANKNVIQLQGRV